MTRRDTTSLAALVGLFLLAAALATRWLTADLLYVDELWSLYKSGGGVYAANLTEIWRRLTEVDPGGMGAAYYYALAGWEALVGGSPLTIRLFSLFFGVLGAAMTYRLSTRLVGRGGGVYAVGLLVGSAFFIDFMHEARAYTMVVFVVTLALEAYWRVSTRPAARPTDYLLLSLSLALVAYTHYVALAAVGALGVYHLVIAAKNRRWFAISAAMSVGGLLYLPWVGVLLEVARRGSEDVGRQAASMDAARALQQVGHGFSNGAIPLLMLLLIPALTAWRHQLGRLLWMGLVIGMALVMMVNARTAFLVHPRYLIFLWPSLAILGAFGLMRLQQRGLPVRLVLGVWLVFGASLTLNPDFSRGMFGAIYRPPNAGIEQAMRVIRPISRDSDVTLFHIAQPTKEPFASFVVGYLMHDIKGRGEQIGWMNSSFAQDDAGYLNAALTALGDAKRVYTVRVPELPDTPQTRVVDYALSQSYLDCGVIIGRDDMQFNAHIRRPDSVRAFRDSAQYVFGDQTTGMAYLNILNPPWDEPQETPPNTITSDPFAMMLMGWTHDNTFTPERYAVSLQMFNEDGALIRQQDTALPITRLGCTHGYIPDIPDGVYRFEVVVYNRETGARLSSHQLNGDFALPSLHIERR